ncbi:hypothetical protein L484_019531 [Morus notabilis]|uniref:Uncharacterized protein n=1 Tax=Morus notabilis TaxID=981085 RepID=W9RBR8_9ROSA|nr:hypothetical protein L484_019531 [Morus notabilis]
MDVRPIMEVVKGAAFELLSEDENSLPLTLQPPKLPGREFGEAKGDSLFSNAIDIRLSDFQRERLKALLQQSAIVLTAESDKVVPRSMVYVQSVVAVLSRTLEKGTGRLYFAL